VASAGSRLIETKELGGAASARLPWQEVNTSTTTAWRLPVSREQALTAS